LLARNVLEWIPLQERVQMALVSQTSEVVGVTQQEGEAAQQMKCHPPSRVQLPSPDEVQKEQRVSEPREYLRVHFSRRRSLIQL